MSADSQSQERSRRGGPPQPIAELLKTVLAQSGVNRRTPRASTIEALWSRAAGAELAMETRPDTLRRGVLTVEVRGAALLAELKAFRTTELLSRLVAEDPSGRVTELRFRPGVF